MKKKNTKLMDYMVSPEGIARARALQRSQIHNSPTDTVLHMCDYCGGYIKNPTPTQLYCGMRCQKAKYRRFKQGRFVSRRREWLKFHEPKYLKSLESTVTQDMEFTESNGYAPIIDPKATLIKPPTWLCDVCGGTIEEPRSNRKFCLRDACKKTRQMAYRNNVQLPSYRQLYAQKLGIPPSFMHGVGFIRVRVKEEGLKWFLENTSFNPLVESGKWKTSKS